MIIIFVGLAIILITELKLVENAHILVVSNITTV